MNLTLLVEEAVLVVTFTTRSNLMAWQAIRTLLHLQIIESNTARSIINQISTHIIKIITTRLGVSVNTQSSKM